jgi:hypothetical protein
MLKEDRQLLSYSAGCIIAIIVLFAAAIFTVAAALKWVLN